MKNFFLYLFLLLGISNVFAQTESKRIDINDYVEVILQKETAAASMVGKISSVEVIDARDDTSEIGLHSTGSLEKEWPRRYRIFPSVKDGVAAWIGNYLKVEKTDSAAGSLLVVIKKYWISSGAVPALLGEDKVAQPNQGFDPGVVTKIEFYLAKDSLFCPLYRIDSVFRINEKLPGDAGFFITGSLKYALQKLADFNLTDIWFRKKKLPLQSILQNNFKALQFPVFEAAGYKKGVYKNFEEFKNNTPSITEYELRKGELGDVLYVKEGATEYPERKAWGFCDGVDLFIHSGDKYSKLLRRQNTFYFGGIKGLARKIKYDPFHSTGSGLMAHSGSLSTTFSKVIKYYKVDMETGLVY